VPELDVRLSPRFLSCLKGLTRAERRRVEQALQNVREGLGKPHRHSGISIRPIRERIFECRAGLDLRLLFRVSPEALDFFFVGDHDAVRRLIRSLK
jgi:hypothetical protein